MIVFEHTCVRSRPPRREAALTQIRVTVLGREVLRIQVGEPEPTAPQPDTHTLEAGSGGQFELSGFGFDLPPVSEHAP
jgi:hypothetical protein